MQSKHTDLVKSDSLINNCKASERIIIVDDDPIVREVLVVNLQTAGFHVRAVDCGQDALQEIERRSYDLIVLDIVMPGIDGWEVCKLIRDNPERKQMKIVFLSAKNTNIDRMIGLDILKADGFLSKPFDITHLMHVIRGILDGTPTT